MTQQQLALYRFIQTYQMKHRHLSPSFREMAEAMECGTGNISRLMKILVFAGHVRPRARNQTRQIELVPLRNPQQVVAPLTRGEAVAFQWEGGRLIERFRLMQEVWSLTE